MANWVIEHNDIHDNNLPNPAPPGTFQAGLPAGRRGPAARRLRPRRREELRRRATTSPGSRVLGWCTAVSLGDPSRNCTNDPPIADPAVERQPRLPELAARQRREPAAARHSRRGHPLPADPFEPADRQLLREEQAEHVHVLLLRARRGAAHRRLLGAAALQNPDLWAARRDDRGARLLDRPPSGGRSRGPRALLPLPAFLRSARMRRRQAEAIYRAILDVLEAEGGELRIRRLRDDLPAEPAGGPRAASARRAVASSRRTRRTVPPARHDRDRAAPA